MARTQWQVTKFGEGGFCVSVTDNGKACVWLGEASMGLAFYTARAAADYFLAAAIVWDETARQIRNALLEDELGLRV